jgi:hypothetical protein
MHESAVVSRKKPAPHSKAAPESSCVAFDRCKRVLHGDHAYKFFNKCADLLRKRAGHAPATLPYSRSPLGELLAPLIACQTVPPIAPIENATPTSSMIRCGQGSRSLGSPMWCDKKAKQGNADLARGKNGLLSEPASFKTLGSRTFQNFAPIVGNNLFATAALAGICRLYRCCNRCCNRCRHTHSSPPPPAFYVSPIPASCAPPRVHR